MLAYRVSDGGRTAPMAQVLCKNEEKELQDLLEHNPDLLPGDQISPEDPRRWLVIAKEMAVEDPNAGEARWSIDFLFADQSGIPTFIEVKRFGDTRSRREVIGQMFDYAANGHYYWTSSHLQETAENYAESRGSTLETALARLTPDDGLEASAYFDRVAENLREGQVRLLFFLEKGSMELKSIVDFLNKQMEKSEVLLVEAHQFESHGMRIVVPQLFGYTEEARRVKRTVKYQGDGARRQWNEESFFTALASQKGEDAREKVFALYEVCRQSGVITWGRGVEKGTFNPKWPETLTQSPFSVATDGLLTVQFQYLQGSDQLKTLSRSLSGLLVDELGITLPDRFENKFPSIPYEQWAPGLSRISGWIQSNLA